MENHSEFTFSEDPIKNTAINNIMDSETIEQLNNSKTYAALAGLLSDELVAQFLEFKMLIRNWK